MSIQMSMYMYSGICITYTIVLKGLRKYLQNSAIV